MTLQVQELISKIKEEGVLHAEQKAKEMEAQAKAKAEGIVQEAQKHADQLIDDAKKENQKIRESTRMALLQASRDMLLNLRKEIEQTLMKVIAQDVHAALTPESLAEIIQATVKGYLNKGVDASDITVALNEKDLAKLKSGFIAKLKNELKQPITFESFLDNSAGFTISFDGGKSCFDFSEVSLVEYLSNYLNVEVASLLKESVSQKVSA